MCAASRDKKPGFDSEFMGEILKIKLRGEIDHHSAVAVRSAIDDMIRCKRPAKLVVDMSSVELMDSSGLGLIMGRYAVMKEVGGQISILDPNPRVKKIMSLAGMERIIKIDYSAQTDMQRVPLKYERPENSAAINSVGGRGQGARRERSSTKAKKEGELK